MSNSKRFSSQSIAEIFTVIYMFTILCPCGYGFYSLLGFDFLANHPVLTAILTALAGWGAIFLLHIPYPLGGLVVATLLSALSTYGLYKILVLYVLSDGCLLIVLLILAFLFFFAGGIYSYLYACDDVIW